MTYEYNLGVRFERTAAAYAERSALRFVDGTAVCYAELSGLANRLARHFLTLGARAGDVVAISGDKTPATFACMVACLKIGAAYTMVDPEIPPERVRRMFAACRPRLLVAGLLRRRELAEVLAASGTEGVPNERDELELRLQAIPDANLPETRRITGESPAYIMHTSGSTGFPKGAVMTHANVLNLISWSLDTFRFIPDDVLTNVNPLYFDNSVFDFYSSVFTGASLVPFPKEVVTDPGILVQKVDAMGCTSWFSVPSLLIFLQTMKALRPDSLVSVRRFIFGGEGYPKAKLKKLWDLYGQRSEIFNVYGPTECTCICSAYRLSSSDFEDLHGLPPLGMLADNFLGLILSEQGHPVADGECGELCLLGPNVGKGYYNDPTRTAAAFVQNPLNNKYREIMYRSGDMVHFNPGDGKIYIHGRQDNQVKHMGYRIEMEEIEAALNAIECVAEAAVLHGAVRGLSQIVAVIAGVGEDDEARIRGELRRVLPEYMIPTVMHFESPLPKNANGKIDRTSLAAKYGG